MESTMPHVKRLSHQLVRTGAEIGREEARLLLNAHQTVQRNRQAIERQLCGTGDSPRCHELVHWLIDQDRLIAKQLKKALDKWSDGVPPARWAKGIVGIGPVMAAGLAVHIDVAHHPTAGDVWAYAGLNPQQEWKPGTRRPWNADVRKLAFQIGESFVRTAGKPNDFYGKLFLERKEREQAANEAGEFAAQAAAALPGVHDAEARRWYEQGKLPPSHIHARARRWAVKLFLSHYHHVAWTVVHGTPPAEPYALAVLAGANYIEPPNFY